ncbi:MAG: hypothetical protein ACK56F_18850, partial [bacterium]
MGVPIQSIRGYRTMGRAKVRHQPIDSRDGRPTAPPEGVWDGELDGVLDMPPRQDGLTRCGPKTTAKVTGPRVDLRDSRTDPPSMPFGFIRAMLALLTSLLLPLGG